MTKHRQEGVFSPVFLRATPLKGAVWVCAALLCGSGSAALAASAEIVMLIGKGDRRTGDRGAWVPAAVKQKLDQGQFVRTLANSQMAIFLPDRTQIRLNQNSQLEVKSVAEAGSWSETLLQAQFRARVEPGPTGAHGQ